MHIQRDSNGDQIQQSFACVLNPDVRCFSPFNFYSQHTKSNFKNSNYLMSLDATTFYLSFTLRIYEHHCDWFQQLVLHGDRKECSSCGMVSKRRCLVRWKTQDSLVLWWCCARKLQWMKTEAEFWDLVPLHLEWYCDKVPIFGHALEKDKEY